MQKGELVGIVTEGDFLRRREIGTERRRPKWLEFVLGPGKLAEEYVHTSGRKVAEIMTPDPWTIGEDDSLEDVVEVMERRHIKRLPVIPGRADGRHCQPRQSDARAGQLVREIPAPAGGDSAIRDAAFAALGKAALGAACQCRRQERRRRIVGRRHRRSRAAGLVVAAENVAGVEKVHDHLVWVEPMSGMAFPSAEDEAKERAAAS